MNFYFDWLAIFPIGNGKNVTARIWGDVGGRSNKHHGHLPISPLGMGKKDCDLGFDLMILGPLGPDSALMGRPGLAIFPIRNGENATAWIWGDVGSVAISIMETGRFAHWAWGKRPKLSLCSMMLLILSGLPFSPSKMGKTAKTSSMFDDVAYLAYLERLAIFPIENGENSQNFFYVR